MTESLEAHLTRQIEHSRRFFWHRLRWRVVRSNLPAGGPFTVVDVGAGAGLLGTFLARDRPQATYRFVEPIESLRLHLRQQYGPQADAGDDRDFADARFVTLLDVLEHQEDDRSFLEDLVAKMQRGSMLLLTVPAEQKLWSQWDVALGHHRRYDKTSLLAAASHLRLDIREVSYLFPEMLPLAHLRARRRSAEPLEKPPEGCDESAEFPDLPGTVNDILYGAGTLSLSLRRRWPGGTSLFMAATVTGRST